MIPDWKPIETIVREGFRTYVFYNNGAMYIGTRAQHEERSSHWDFLPEAPIEGLTAEALMEQMCAHLGVVIAVDGVPYWAEIARRLEEHENAN